MKYMGSKRTMLTNGLGTLILAEVEKYNRFVDMFSGASFVSWFVAERNDIPVLAIDLQRYSTILADAVISRTHPFSSNELIETWIRRSINSRNKTNLWKLSTELEKNKENIPDYVEKARELCSVNSPAGPIWNAYGGHYFSPSQALTFDYLLKYLPENKGQRNLCLAACINAASECVASPGHTAQPFQPTITAGKYILESWEKDPVEKCKTNLKMLGQRFAKVKGSSITDDAQNVLGELKSTDLVFIDPPYSGVQYSRFYHVLETIARQQKIVEVSGVGRYPSLKDRPQSKFSNKGQSIQALKELLSGIAEKGSTVIFTFPSGETSNGLSGDLIIDISKEWFTVSNNTTVKGKFSTLGGNNEVREARKKSKELILLMHPK